MANLKIAQQPIRPGEQATFVLTGPTDWFRIEVYRNPSTEDATSGELIYLQWYETATVTKNVWAPGAISVPWDGTINRGPGSGGGAVQGDFFAVIVIPRSDDAGQKSPADPDGGSSVGTPVKVDALDRLTLTNWEKKPIEPGEVIVYTVRQVGVLRVTFRIIDPDGELEAERSHVASVGEVETWGGIEPGVYRWAWDGVSDVVNRPVEIGGYSVNVRIDINRKIAKRRLATGRQLRHWVITAAVAFEKVSEAETGFARIGDNPDSADPDSADPDPASALQFLAWAGGAYLVVRQLGG